MLKEQYRNQYSEETLKKTKLKEFLQCKHEKRATTSPNNYKTQELAPVVQKLQKSSQE